MVPLRIGLGLSARLWLSPAGGLLALFLLSSGSLLTFLSPASALGPERGGGAGLVGLALLGGTALALVGLGRRGAFLELLPLGPRIGLQAVVLVATALGAVAWAGAGALALAGWALPLGAAPVAALHLAGLALPLLALRLHEATRLGAFLGLVWWLPALVLAPSGWQGHLQRAFSPAGSLVRAASDSADPGTMLPSAFLAGAVALGGVLTARTVARIG